MQLIGHRAGRQHVGMARAAQTDGGVALPIHRYGVAPDLVGNPVAAPAKGVPVIGGLG
jgi:hypothetical protein